jgi:predicted neuraminidase
MPSSSVTRRDALAALLAAGSASSAAQSSPRVQRSLPTEVVADRSVPTGQYKHPAAVTELANGDLLVAWYGGDGEYAPNTGVYGVCLPAGNRNLGSNRQVASNRQGGLGAHWSTPVLLARDPFRSVGNPVVWQAPTINGQPGWVWLFYVVRFGDTWAYSRIAAKVSKDGARTWSDASLISLDEGLLVRGKPITLSNGDTLLPVYREVAEDRESVGPDTVSLFLRHQPKDNTWTVSAPIRSAMGNLQPAPAEVAPGRLLAFCRRGGDYQPNPNGWVVYAESSDFGATWSPGRPLAPHFPNPNASVELLALRNGHLLLVYNHSHGSRSPLSLALSEDGGKSWKVGLDIATGAQDYAYPYAIQASDDRIHLVYTSHRRSQVNRAVFTEDEIRDAFPQTIRL